RSKTSLPLTLKSDLCKGMNIDPRNCLLVTGVLEAFDKGSIEPILRASTEYLRKCKMRGRIFVREEGAFAVLCELPSAVDPLQPPLPWSRLVQGKKLTRLHLLGLSLEHSASSAPPWASHSEPTQAESWGSHRVLHPHFAVRRDS
uniref:Paraneoplastic antigen Ma-like N-terminal domain-containing protein n=1 Tax=Chelonoidis abingdonii TaxID=106734 RepID=A0A8C0G7R2_CHEAB